MHCWKILFILTCLIYFSPLVADGAVNRESSDAESDWLWEDEESQNTLSWGYYHNIDLYYANAGVIFNLSDHAIPDIGSESEGNVYVDLFKRSGLPQYILFEFSVYPMPIAGIYMKKYQQTLYRDADIASNFNLLESITAGFDEPYALSMFLNNMVTYGTNGDLENSNRGFMGYLFTVGNYHIQRNRLVKDNWLELEWKIKGDIKREEERLSWSFRVGGKFHEHPEIVDNYYIILRRDQVDHTKPILSWLYNSGIELTYNIDQSDFKSIGFQLLFEKNIPVKLGNTVFSLSIGIIQENINKYRGELKDAQSRESETFFIVRPSIEF